ncbi:MAG: hypothetical protein KGI33_01510 [Thaumarchaeota archaeon]|nr:hypothetical protein [Nitrososphaerota archaeon]
MATKLKDDSTFTKYDIEISIDEVESEDSHVRLKYRFLLLSNPTNVKLTVDGFTTIFGNAQEIARHLGNDEGNIPYVVNSLYREIFPFLYVTSKTMQIPCPAYKLSEIGRTQSGFAPQIEKFEEKHNGDESNEEAKQETGTIQIEDQTDDVSTESLIQEQKIPTV